MACSGNCSGCSSSGSCADEKKEPILKTVKRAILVMSGKGGVGKSTVAASLAVTLAKQGRKVGVLDADFHGPSQPTLFNAAHLHMEGSEEGMIPLEISGIKLVSIGLLLEECDKAIVWRGPVKMGVIKQLLEAVVWGELDDLIIDFPPGTGDEAISACQLVDCDKVGVIVTTPQEVALADCRKCIDDIKTHIMACARVLLTRISQSYYYIHTLPQICLYQFHSKCIIPFFEQTFNLGIDFFR